MRIGNLKFKNIYGIEEISLKPGDITLFEGVNGAGKTSFLHALNLAFSNEGLRTKIIKNTADEAELQVTLDDGTTINRKKRNGKSDTISVTKDNMTQTGPETFLKRLFSGEQFDPIKDFIDRSDMEQKKILLSLCVVEWTDQDWIDAIGEVPKFAGAFPHILEALDYGGGKNGPYYIEREGINREVREKEATKKNITKDIPDKYDPEIYRSVSINQLQQEIHEKKEQNSKYMFAKTWLAGKADLITDATENFEAKKIIKAGYIEESLERLGDEVDNKKAIIKCKISAAEMEIAALEKQIEEYEDIFDRTEANFLRDVQEARKVVEIQSTNIEEEKRKELEKIEKQAAEYEKYMKEQVPIDIDPLIAEAEHIERMKDFIRDFDRGAEIDRQCIDLKNKSHVLTEKIEKIRSLPEQILKTASMPVEGLNLIDGELLINGLPIDNLSDGEKMRLALRVAINRVGDLKIVLVDKFESLDKKQRDLFLQTAKQAATEEQLQFFITRVTDDDELKIIEL